MAQPPLLWQTPDGFDIGSVSLDLGDGRRQSVLAILGFNGRDLDRVYLAHAASLWSESGDTEDLTALASMALLIYHSPQHQSHWPIAWQGQVIADRRQFRALSRRLDWADVMTSSLGEALSEGEPRQNTPPLPMPKRRIRGVRPLELLAALERLRTTEHDQVYSAHTLARWNVPPREYGEPALEDLVWVEARARDLLTQWRAARSRGNSLDLVAALNQEIVAAIELGAHAMSRLAAWRLLLQRGYELLIDGRAIVYAQALNELREASANGEAPQWIRDTLDRADPLHSLLYRPSSDFAGELFQFKYLNDVTISLRFPAFVDVAIDVWGREWVSRVFRATLDSGLEVERRALLAGYHALAAFVASYRGTRGEPTRFALRRHEQSHTRIGDETEFRHGGVDADQRAINSEIMAKASEAIGNSRAFEALLLVGEGHSLQEVADILGIGKTRAKQLVDAARARAKQAQVLLDLIGRTPEDIDRLTAE